jgi:hypothetical protein
MRKMANEYWMEKSFVFLTFCLYISSVFWVLRRDALFPTAVRSSELSRAMGAGACCGYGTFRSSAYELGLVSGERREWADGARTCDPPGWNPGDRPLDPTSEYIE